MGWTPFHQQSRQSIRGRCSRLVGLSALGAFLVVAYLAGAIVALALIASAIILPFALAAGWRAAKVWADSATRIDS